MTVRQAFELALQHQYAGRLREAERILRQILTHDPSDPNALHVLGLILIQSGDASGGINLIRRAVQTNPTATQYLNNLAIALTNIGQHTEAIQVLSKSIQINPTEPESHFNLANALRLNGQTDEAIVAYRHTLRLRNNHHLALNNLGTMLYEQSHIDEAIACYREALRHRPDHANSYSNLGNVLRDKGQFEEATASLQRALELNPNHADACNNLANLLRDAKRIDEAIVYYERAIRINPELADAHYNLAAVLLMKGDFARGWGAYEWRWRIKNFLLQDRNFAAPRWAGEALQGRTILVHAEQGFGDTLQFVRYVSEIAARGGDVIIECQRELLRLLNAFPGTKRVIAKGDPLPAFDLHCPLLSLPFVFNTTLQTIPTKVPYLNAEDSLVQKWRPRVDLPYAHFRVGLVWAGSPTHRGDRFRSMHLENLRSLSTADVTFFSLQKGTIAQELMTPPLGMKLVDLGVDLTDFSETAAVLSHLDLVISVDTAVAHLAGALGRPVWVLLPFVAEWRWLLDRKDSPWYPTMRLFRQERPGDWEELVRRVAQELNRLARNQR